MGLAGLLAGSREITPLLIFPMKLRSFGLAAGFAISTGFALAGPKRDPNTPGYVPLQPTNPAQAEIDVNAALRSALSADPAAKAALDAHPNLTLLDATFGVPPPDKEGNFLIGPNYTPATETVANPNVPKGDVYRFTLRSEDSKFYPGIDRVPNTLGTVDPNNKYTLLVPNSQSQPYTRAVLVYVPKQYVPGTAAPFMVGADGPDAGIAPLLDNLIAEHKIPPVIAISIAHGGTSSSDAQGSERGLEYDTMSGKYAEFVETEVLPQVESRFNVKLTKDPEGRATWGSASGGSCALIMAWYHPEWYHRVMTFSGTYVNQQWPFNPAIPHGAWEFHEHLIAESPAKPIRLWFEVGDSDNYNPNVMLDDMHDWVQANENMAKVLKEKGYHYQFVFALNAGHTDRNARAHVYAEALEWLWQGYPKDAAK